MPNQAQANELLIRVPAIPIAQPRQRHRVVSVAGKTIATNYTPKKDPVNDYKAIIRICANAEYDGPPLTGPLRVDIEAVFPRTKGQIWKTKPMPRLPHDKKPDRDNVDKAILDALKGLLWVDDSQVCRGEVQKWIAAGDEQPHVMIRVSKV